MSMNIGDLVQLKVDPRQVGEVIAVNQFGWRVVVQWQGKKWESDLGIDEVEPASEEHMS